MGEERETEFLQLHQHRALEALHHIDRALSQSCVDYYLLAGSCLGAVREKGMIPWDDDIDIGIKNEHYAAARTAILEALRDCNDFCYKDWETDREFPRMYGKVLTSEGEGVIDIFRLIQVPESHLVQHLQWSIKKLLNSARIRKTGWAPASFASLGSRVRYALNSMATLPVRLILSLDRITELLIMNENRCCRENAPYTNMYSIYSRQQELIPFEWLSSPSVVTFHDLELLSVGDLHGYLTKLYGDYETPTPEEKRFCSHVNNRF